MEPFEGRWWRADRYEVRGGYVLPVEGAQFVPYRPWEAYRDAIKNAPQVQEDKEPIPTPHGDLLDLALRWGTQTIVSEESAIPLIENWCCRWGLLGIALHQAVEVTLPATTAKPEDGPSAQFRQVRHTVIGGRWKTCIQTSDHDTAPEPSVNWRGPPHLLDGAPKPTRIDERPSYRLASGWDHPIGASWAEFFPRIPSSERNTYQCPSPTRRVFWRHYAEPLDDWIFWLHVFSNWAVRLRRAKQKVKIGPSTAFMNEVSWFVQELSHATSAASPYLQPNESGEYDPLWSWPSLLTAIALMIREDLLGKDSDFCENKFCGRYFFKAKTNQKYCCFTCKNRTGSRRVQRKIRSDRKKERKARAESKSPSRKVR